jgi:cell division protein ZapE
VREPRGATDYLAIARRFHTASSSACRNDREMRNEAARFVTLIDALYEHRVKLLAAADAEPEGLYPRRRALRVRANGQRLRNRAQIASAKGMG